MRHVEIQLVGQEGRTICGSQTAGIVIAVAPTDLFGRAEHPDVRKQTPLLYPGAPPLPQKRPPPRMVRERQQRGITFGQTKFALFSAASEQAFDKVLPPGIFVPAYTVSRVFTADLPGVAVDCSSLGMPTAKPVGAGGGGSLSSSRQGVFPFPTSLPAAAHQHHQQPTSGRELVYCLDVQMEGKTLEKCIVAPQHRRIYKRPAKLPAAVIAAARPAIVNPSNATTSKGKALTSKKHTQLQKQKALATSNVTYGDDLDEQQAYANAAARRHYLTTTDYSQKPWLTAKQLMDRVNAMCDEREKWNLARVPRVRNPFSSAYHMDEPYEFLDADHYFTPTGKDEEKKCLALIERERSIHIEVLRRRWLMDVVVNLQQWIIQKWFQSTAADTDMSAMTSSNGRPKRMKRGTKKTKNTSLTGLAYDGSGLQAQSLLQPVDDDIEELEEVEAESFNTRLIELGIAQLEDPPSYSEFQKLAMPKNTSRTTLQTLRYLWKDSQALEEIFDDSTSTSAVSSKRRAVELSTGCWSPLRLLVACCLILNAVDKIDQEEFQIQICLATAVASYDPKKLKGKADHDMVIGADIRRIWNILCARISGAEVSSPAPRPDPWLLPRNITLLSSHKQNFEIATAEFWYADSPDDLREYNSGRTQRQCEFLRVFADGAIVAGEAIWFSSVRFAYRTMSDIRLTNTPPEASEMAWAYTEDDEFGGACSLLSLARTGGFKNPPYMQASWVCRDWCAAQCTFECRPSCHLLSICCAHYRARHLWQSLEQLERSCFPPRSDNTTITPATTETATTPNLVRAKQWLLSLPHDIHMRVVDIAAGVDRNQHYTAPRLLHPFSVESGGCKWYVTSAVFEFLLYGKEKTNEFTAAYMLDTPRDELIGTGTLWKLLSKSTQSWLMAVWNPKPPLDPTKVSNVLRLLPDTMDFMLDIHVSTAVAHVKSQSKHSISLATSNFSQESLSVLQPDQQMHDEEEEEEAEEGLKRKAATAAAKKRRMEKEARMQESMIVDVTKAAKAQVQSSYAPMIVDKIGVLWFMEPQYVARLSTTIQNERWYHYLRLRSANPRFQPRKCIHPSAMTPSNWKELAKRFTFLDIVSSAAPPDDTKFPKLNRVIHDQEDGMDCEDDDEILEEEARRVEAAMNMSSSSSDSDDEEDGNEKKEGVGSDAGPIQFDEFGQIQFRMRHADGRLTALNLAKFGQSNTALGADDDDDDDQARLPPIPEELILRRDVQERLLRYFCVRTDVSGSTSAFKKDTKQKAITSSSSASLSTHNSWDNAYFVTNWVDTYRPVRNVVQFVFPGRAFPLEGRPRERFQAFTSAIEHDLALKAFRGSTVAAAAAVSR